MFPTVPSMNEPANTDYALTWAEKYRHFLWLRPPPRHTVSETIPIYLFGAFDVDWKLDFKLWRSMTNMTMDSRPNYTGPIDMCSPAPF